MSVFDQMIARGFPPQAATHEAGHRAVDDTMGLAPDRHLRLFKRRGQWAGENIEVDPAEAHPLEDEDRYQAAALQVIGGFISEVLAGHGHLYSSIDERACLLAAMAAETPPRLQPQGSAPGPARLVPACSAPVVAGGPRSPLTCDTTEPVAPAHRRLSHPRPRPFDGPCPMEEPPSC